MADISSTNARYFEMNLRKEEETEEMYDLSSKFNTFYRLHVVLPQANQNELYEKKNLNIQRLKDGLREYNEENGTSYSVEESSVQGSVAMSTVVQNRPLAKIRVQ